MLVFTASRKMTRIFFFSLFSKVVANLKTRVLTKYDFSGKSSPGAPKIFENYTNSVFRLSDPKMLVYQPRDVLHKQSWGVAASLSVKIRSIAFTARLWQPSKKGSILSTLTLPGGRPPNFFKILKALAPIIWWVLSACENSAKSERPKKSAPPL